MPVETAIEKRPAVASSAVGLVRRVDARGLTITTAIALAAHEALAELAVGRACGGR
jgi:hypothetical protein